MQTKGNKQTVDLLRERVISPKALSYLWLALENDFNIVLFCKEKDDSNTFIEALMELYPRSKKPTTKHFDSSKTIPFILDELGKTDDQNRLLISIESDDFPKLGRKVLSLPPDKKEGIYNVLDIVVSLNKPDDASANRTIDIMEVVGEHEASMIVNKIFFWDKHYDWFFFSGHSYMFDRILLRKGIDKEQLKDGEGKIFEDLRNSWEHRAVFLRWLAHKNSDDPEKYMIDFENNPESVVEMCIKELENVDYPGKDLPDEKARVDHINKDAE